jgi:hypothetical protein
VRRSTVEHPFASIKAWMGATHFRMKTLKHVATEMALHVLAYNLKRVMAILGVRELLESDVRRRSPVCGCGDPRATLSRPDPVPWPELPSRPRSVRVEQSHPQVRLHGRVMAGTDKKWGRLCRDRLA